MSDVDTDKSNQNPTAEEEGLTYVLKIIDKSGSMHTVAYDVIGGFNSYIQELINDTDRRYVVSVSLFNHTYTQLCTALNVKDVPKLSAFNYRPSGYTALLDAVGKTITDFQTAVPELGENDRVLVVINTDGHENDSREYTNDTIKEMIIGLESTEKWSFIYLGQHADAWDQAAKMGFRSANTVQVGNTSADTRMSYDSLSVGTQSYARGAKGQTVAETVRKGQNAAE